MASACVSARASGAAWQGLTVSIAASFRVRIRVQRDAMVWHLGWQASRRHRRGAGRRGAGGAAHPGFASVNRRCAPSTWLAQVSDKEREGCGRHSQAGSGAERPSEGRGRHASRACVLQHHRWAASDSRHTSDSRAHLAVSDVEVSYRLGGTSLDRESQVAQLEMPPFAQQL